MRLASCGPINGLAMTLSSLVLLALILSNTGAILRPYGSGVKLAKARHRTTTSTTTTTTTASTTTAGEPVDAEPSSGGVSADDAEDSGDSDDYQPIEDAPYKSKSTARPPSRSKTTSSPRRPEGKKGSRNRGTSTTTTTTTTEAPLLNEDEAEAGDEGDESEEVEDEQNKNKYNLPKTTTTTTTMASPLRYSSMEKSMKATRKEDEEKSVSGRQLIKNTTMHHHVPKRKPLVALPFIKPKNASVCISEAFLEFPTDLFGDKWRSRGLVLIHILVVCYMFYSLALVCERYFMPSLEEFAQRLNLSQDVAGATLMSAGSSAPELFTAILGVFVAKGDVGTGAIVGSAVFNILFVIGLCAFVSTTTAQLQWWPVLRDSIYYTFTVLVLILIIYDERVTALESFAMLTLYGVYILIMANNETLKEIATKLLVSHPLTAKIIGANGAASEAAAAAGLAADGPDDVFDGSSSSALGTANSGLMGTFFGKSTKQQQQVSTTNRKQTNIEDDSMYLAALLIIIKHKRLFRSTIRFQSAARYVIVKMQHRAKQKQKSATAALKRSGEVDYFETNPLRPDLSSTGQGQGQASMLTTNQRTKMEAYALGGSMSKNKFSIVSREDYEFWNMPPAEGENYYLWLAKIPVNYVLHYTIPDCTLYPDKYIFTFFISIIWTACFSYIMVWMVTLIGYTFGIPDSVMGVTFLAAGTSVPDCYSSIHAARNGMADMAVSNSIGSNVFDILIGLAVPWFIQSAIYPGMVATINSRGVIYSVVLLFLSLIVTIYLLNKYEWSLQPRLGLALLIAYALFILLTCMLEFNLFGHVNPPPCPVPASEV